MKDRRFGRLGWEVSEVGYGMWGMSGWTGSSEQEAFDALQRSVELGCTFFDTAWAYGEGHSESMLGRLVRANPSRRLFTATKIPPRNRCWPSRREHHLDDCYPPEYMEEYVHRSLRNSGLSRFDLVQFHTWEDSWMEDDRWVRKMDDLRSQGLLQGVGISINRWEPWNALRAVRSGLIDAVQVIYNLFDQAPEDELFPACREHGVAVIARVPFDEGSLTGTLTKETTWPQGDWRNTYFVKDNLAQSVDRAEALKTLLPSGMSLPELAIRFILSHPDVSTVIPGMRQVRHVEENVESGNHGPLSAEMIRALRAHRWDRTPTRWSQ